MERETKQIFKKKSIFDNKLHIEVHVIVKIRKAQFLIFIVYLAFNKHSMDESRGGVSPLPNFCIAIVYPATS